MTDQQLAVILKFARRYVASGEAGATMLALVHVADQCDAQADRLRLYEAALRALWGDVIRQRQRDIVDAALSDDPRGQLAALGITVEESKS